MGEDPAAIRDWAQAAESLGFDHVIAYDHVLGAVHANRAPPLMGPYTEKDAFHEPFVLYAYLAAITRKLELCTGVIILPQRQTVLVAKQAAEVQLLSQGRLRLGVGTGWNFVEYESLGMRFEDRGKMLDEQVELMRKLWREPVLDYRGKFHRVDRAGILPRPRREIPIWFGGFTPVAVKRAARVGDGILFGTYPSRMQKLWEMTQVELKKAGRSPGSFGAEAAVDASDSPDTWVKEAALWREAGGTHLSLRAMDTAADQVGHKRFGFRGPQDYIAALERFAAAVR
ncbi:MAG TPA: LLM class F420-dependent oxidoreductase [Myxococcota bacterium]|nr:LLM class F420-dependent oxidoreductase [Myxococcota bacterium]